MGETFRSFVVQKDLPSPSGEPLAYSPNRAAIVIGVSPRSVYQKIATGDLRSYKDGKRRLIPYSELQDYVNRQFNGGAK
jgi:excisionase family DNA binding protein